MSNSYATTLVKTFSSQSNYLQNDAFDDQIASVEDATNHIQNNQTLNHNHNHTFHNNSASNNNHNNHIQKGQHNKHDLNSFSVQSASVTPLFNEETGETLHHMNGRQQSKDNSTPVGFNYNRSHSHPNMMTHPYPGNNNTLQSIPSSTAIFMSMDSILSNDTNISLHNASINNNININHNNSNNSPNEVNNYNQLNASNTVSPVSNETSNTNNTIQTSTNEESGNYYKKNEIILKNAGKKVSIQTLIESDSKQLKIASQSSMSQSNGNDNELKEIQNAVDLIGNNSNNNLQTNEMQSQMPAIKGNSNNNSINNSHNMDDLFANGNISNNSETKNGNNNNNNNGNNKNGINENTLQLLLKDTTNDSDDESDNSSNDENDSKLASPNANILSEMWKSSEAEYAKMEDENIAQMRLMFDNANSNSTNTQNSKKPAIISNDSEITDKSILHEIEAIKKANRNKNNNNSDNSFSNISNANNNNKNNDYRKSTIVAIGIGILKDREGDGVVTDTETTNNTVDNFNQANSFLVSNNNNSNNTGTITEEKETETETKTTQQIDFDSKKQKPYRYDSDEEKIAKAKAKGKKKKANSGLLFGLFSCACLVWQIFIYLKYNSKINKKHKTKLI